MELHTTYPTVWSAGEIVKKLPNIKTRQILDLAEKGLIKPARETAGAGSPRLYDFMNIFDACVCLAVRGRIPASRDTRGIAAEILETIHEKMDGGTKKPSFDLLFVTYNNEKHILFTRRYDESLGDVLKPIPGHVPEGICTYSIDVSKLWRVLEELF